MCSIQDNERNQKPVNDGASSGGGRPLKVNQTEKSLTSFCLTLNFIWIWLQSFKTNYEHQTEISGEEMFDMFQEVSVNIPKPVDYRKKTQMLLTNIGGK